MLFRSEEELVPLAEVVDICRKTSKQKITYTVQPGDSLSGITNKLKINMVNLFTSNEGLTETSVLRIGQVLNAEIKVPLLGVELIETVASAETTEAP